MRKTIEWLMVGLTLSAASALAQDPARQALAEELLVAMEMPATIEKFFAMMKQVLPAQMEKMRQATGQANAVARRPDQTNQMLDLLAEVLSWDKIKDDYVALYAETFTTEEMKGLIVFYTSPAGQAFTRKQPELTQRTVEMSQRLMMQIMPKIQVMAREPAESASSPATKEKTGP